MANPTKCVPGTITRVMRYADGSEEVIDVIKPATDAAPAKPRVTGSPAPTLDEYRRLFNAGKLRGVFGQIANAWRDSKPVDSNAQPVQQDRMATMKQEISTAWKRK